MPVYARTQEEFEVATGATLNGVAKMQRNPVGAGRTRDIHVAEMPCVFRIWRVLQVPRSRPLELAPVCSAPDASEGYFEMSPVFGFWQWH